MTVRANKMAFETQYSDKSGVEYAVRLTSDSTGQIVELESINTITFPIDKIEWIRDCLWRIQQEIPKQEP